MSLAWKVLLPLGVVNLIAVAILGEIQDVWGDEVHSFWICLGGWLVGILAWKASIANGNRSGFT